MDESLFRPWLSRWNLISDGAPFMTHSSQLLPVKTVTDGTKAMLKITHDKDEKRGNALMAWWGGKGAAPVIACENEAIVLKRASGSVSLATMSKEGRDSAACQILCFVANQLHESRTQPLPPLMSLNDWFCPLKPAALNYGGFLTQSLQISEALLSSPRNMVVLHGDLHHDNVLDFEASGWLAIDPKGLKGERGFDYANLFRNPDCSDPVANIAVTPEIFKQRLQIISRMAGLERKRLLMWIIAWCGLSAAWSLEEDSTISFITVKTAELALAELGQ